MERGQKSFKEDGKYDIICSGSLMGINYKKIEFNSVGFKEDYVLHSLDYEEDITKYAIGLDQRRVLTVYKNIPVFLGNENKKY